VELGGDARKGIGDPRVVDKQRFIAEHKLIITVYKWTIGWRMGGGWQGWWLKGHYILNQNDDLEARDQCYQLRTFLHKYRTKLSPK
jgi:hypothetical protein